MNPREQLERVLEEARDFCSGLNEEQMNWSPAPGGVEYRSLPRPFDDHRAQVRRSHRLRAETDNWRRVAAGRRNPGALVGPDIPEDPRTARTADESEGSSSVSTSARAFGIGCAGGVLECSRELAAELASLD